MNHFTQFLPHPSPSSPEKEQECLDLSIVDVNQQCTGKFGTPGPNLTKNPCSTQNSGKYSNLLTFNSE